MNAVIARKRDADKVAETAGISSGKSRSPGGQGVGGGIGTPRFLQRQAQTVPRDLVQTRLTIGQLGDKYEQEADRVAERVMRMPEPQVQRQACSFPSCEEEDEDNKILQTKFVASTGSAQTTDNPLIQSVLSSPGQPLDAATRSFMEPRLGQDFSGVRVHTDGQAAESSRSIHAHAYTIGHDVVFAVGRYSPGSTEGKELLAHELAHVVQQTGGAVPKIQRKPCNKGPGLQKGDQGKICSLSETKQPLKFLITHDATGKPTQNKPVDVEAGACVTVENVERGANNSTWLTVTLQTMPLKNSKGKIREELVKNEGCTPSEPVTTSPAEPAPSITAASTYETKVEPGSDTTESSAESGFDPTALIKERAVNAALDLALQTVDRFPGHESFGDLWPIARKAIISFYRKLRTQDTEVKVRAFDKLTSILSGKDVAFSEAFLRGYAKGFIDDGVLGLFFLVKGLCGALLNLEELIDQIENEIGGFSAEIRRLAMGWADIRQTILDNYASAETEFIALLGDPQEMTSLISKATAPYAEEAGEKMADELLDFFSASDASARSAAVIGSIVGNAHWELIFFVVTAGIGAAKGLLQRSAQAIVRLLKRVVGSFLRVFNELKTVLTKAIVLVKKVAGLVTTSLGKVTEKLGTFLEDLESFFSMLIRNCHESKLTCSLPGKTGSHKAGTTSFKLSQDAEQFRVKGLASTKNNPWIDRHLKPSVIDELRIASDPCVVAKELNERGIISTYKAFSRAVAELGGQYQAHHIVEAKVLKRLGFPEDLCPSVILTADEHKKISGVLGKLIPPEEIEHMTRRQIREAYKSAYKGHPAWFKLVAEYFPSSG